MTIIKNTLEAIIEASKTNGNPYIDTELLDRVKDCLKMLNDAEQPKDEPKGLTLIEDEKEQVVETKKVRKVRGERL